LQRRREYMYEKVQMLILGLVLSIAIIISTYLVTDVIRDVRLSHQIIKVRGYAEKVVDSDLAIWRMNLSVRNRDMIEGFTAIDDVSSITKKITAVVTVDYSMK